MRVENCERCGCEKFWNGDKIDCPFQTSEEFSTNWNCRVINDIRSLCLVAMEGGDPRLHYQYCDDQKYVVIKTDEIENMGLCLWVTWYKSRGGTDSMWLLDSSGLPRVPKFEDLKAIISHYSELINLY